MHGGTPQSRQRQSQREVAALHFGGCDGWYLGMEVAETESGMALLMALGRVSKQGILLIVSHGRCTCPLGRSGHRQSRAPSKSTGLEKGTARGSHGGREVSGCRGAVRVVGLGG
jgi:hypothetical protein